MTYTVQELKETIGQIKPLEYPKEKPSTPYFFVGPTPLTPELYKRLTDPKEFEAFLKKKYKLETYPEGLTIDDILQRSFRSELAVGGVIKETFKSTAEAIGLPKGHKLGQVNGGGHQAATVLFKNLLVVDPKKDNQDIYVDNELGGAFRDHLSFRQLKKTLKHYLEKLAYKQHIVTDTRDEGRELPTAEELEKKNIKFFFGTANETSTAHSYSDKDWEELRKWKEKDPENRFIILDITSAVGASDLSKHWDIIDAAFFPPQKAIGAPAETGFIVLGPHAVKFMESVKPVGLDVTDQLFNKTKDPNKPRALREELFFDPNSPERPISVINSVNLKKYVETTICADYYNERGGEKGAIERGTKNLETIEKWMENFKKTNQTPVFDYFIHEKEHRSKSVGLIDITDPRFRKLSPDAQDRCLQLFHNLIGDQGIKLPEEEMSPLNVAYDIKTFPKTPLPSYKQKEIDKIRGIRFWLNIEPEKLESLLQWIEPVYNQALKITLNEELEKLQKQSKEENKVFSSEQLRSKSPEPKTSTNWINTAAKEQNNFSLNH